MSAQPQSALRTSTNLLALIAADPAIVALAKAEMGLAADKDSLVIVRGNLAITQLKESEFPCIIGELADGQGEPDVVGGGSQKKEGDFPFALAWKQKDRETAYATRLKLVDLVPGVPLANPGLDASDGAGIACDGCWVDAWISNRGNPAQAPVQWMQFNVHAQWQV